MGRLGQGCDRATMRWQGYLDRNVQLNCVAVYWGDRTIQAQLPQTIETGINKR
jgi:hypothetical protein